MPKRSRGLPDWFDLSKYDCLEGATLEDWLIELTNRHSDFETLRRHKAGEKVNSKSLGIAQYHWERIRQDGSLTGRHRAALNKIERHLGSSAEDLAEDLEKIQLEGNEQATQVLSEFGETLEVRSFVRRLTKGDVLFRLMFSSQIDTLADEINAGAFETSLLSPIPMDTLGRTGGVDSHYERFIKVDLGTPDEFIEQEFREWLAEQRKRSLDAGIENPRLASQEGFADWRTYKVLPYIDLSFACEYDGYALTQHAMGNALFPDSLDVAVAERVRKVVKPRAAILLSRAFLDGLERQLRFERKGKEQKTE